MSIRRSQFRVLMTVLAVITLGSCSKDISLSLRLRKGETYRTRMTTDRNISQTIRGQRQDIEQTVGMAYTVVVEGVDADRVASVKATCDWVSFEQDWPVGKVEYDSSNPPAAVHPLAMGYATLKGQSLSMRVAPDGHVEEIRAADAVRERMANRLDLPPGAMGDALKKSLRDQFGDGALKEMMGRMTAVLPDKTVTIGDSWTRTVTVHTQARVIVDSTWTLDSRRRGVAVISVSSTVKSDPEAAPIEMGPRKLSYELSGTQEGTLELNQATGWIIRGKLTEQLSGKVSLGDMYGPISIQTVTTLEPVEG